MNKLPFTILICCATLVYSCSESNSHLDPTQVQNEVQFMFDSYVEEVNNEDIANVHRYFSDDGEFYWVEDGILQYPDKAALLAGVKAFYPTVETVDLQVSRSEVSVIDRQLATLYVQYKQEVKLTSGFQFTLDGAMTILTKKEGSTWKFFQGHSSIKKPRGE